MDERTRRRLLIGFLTTWVSKLASTLIQFIQVPLLLHFWSLPMNGEWMILTAIPSYLGFSDVGFGSVAGNEMTMLVARGEQGAALAVFQSCWWLITLLVVVAGALMSLGICFLPMSHLLHLQSISYSDARAILFWLGLSVLLGQLEQLLQSAWRCIARYSYGSFVKSALSLVAFAIHLVPVCLGYGPRTAAMALALANIGVTLLLCFLVRHDIPWVSFGWHHASWTEVRRLARPAVAFLGFPLGNALNNQGTLMAVGYALGPMAVVMFGTARTVSRIALQIVQMVNNTVWPELSIAFGAGDLGLVRTLHRRACQVALFISLLVVISVAILGPSFLHHWTVGKVPPSAGLIDLLLIVVVFYSLWSTSSTLVSAINRHERLALLYSVATGLTVSATYGAARRWGLYGAAGSLLISELIMNTYVLPASLRIAGDSWRGFLGSFVDVPEAIHPFAWARRLRPITLRVPKPGVEM